MKAGESFTRIDTPKSYQDYLKESGYSQKSIESFIKRFEREKYLEKILPTLDNPYLFSSKDDRYGNFVR